MSSCYNVLNELVVDIFNNVINIEQEALRSGEFKDLSVTEIHTIEAIGMYRQKSMSVIAAELGITVGTLTTAVTNLVKKGYVQRNRTEEDRRVVMVELTKRGKLAYRIHEKFHTDMIKATIEGLTPEEEVVLAKSMEKLQYFFKNKYNIKNGGN